MKQHKGFTVLEIIVVLLVVATGTVLFFIQKTSIDALNRDSQRKIAINAMYFSLEEDFYAHNKYYPETISPENIRSIDPELFTDPFGTVLGTEGCTYRYEPTNCNDGKCKSYTLRAIMEKEDTFIRQSRNSQ